MVEEIAGLSNSELSSAEFYAELLGRVVSGLAAAGGVVWNHVEGGRLEPKYQILPAEVWPAEGEQDHQRRLKVIQGVLQAGEARLVPPHSGSLGENRAANPTEFLLVICPWKVDDELSGVIEVFQRPGASPKAQRGYLRFLTVICELVADFHRNRRLRESQKRMAQWGRFEQFVRRVHGSLDLRATAYEIANEGRRVVGSDRMSVAICRGSTCRLLAISGVDTLNRRANVVRRLEQLTAAVMAGGEPLWHTESPQELPPGIEEPLSAYLDEAHVRMVAVIPLTASDAQPHPERSRPTAVLVVERFHGGGDDELRERVEAVRVHGTSAMRNALELQSVPLIGLLRALGKVRGLVWARQLPKTILVLFAVAAVVVAMAIVPADFDIEARGELQPLKRRDVFAPDEGVITDLQVVHGQRVEGEEVLAVLRNPKLDLEFHRVWGELQTAQKRLAALEAERLQNLRETAGELRRYNQLTAEAEEHKELVRSLKKQYEIVRTQQAALKIRSPVDGRVLTWNLKQLLDTRPVQRGQTLMSVATLEGPWVLELRVPDDRIGHVLSAQREFGQELGLSFILATDSSVTYDGRIREVAARTEITESEEAIVLVTAYVDRDAIAKRVPGATVVAKIHCGRRPIGYVWLHTLWETVYSWIMF